MSELSTTSPAYGTTTSMRRQCPIFSSLFYPQTCEIVQFGICRNDGRCAVVCLFLDGKMDTESDYEEQGFSSATLQSNHSGNVVESGDRQHSEPCLQRNFTVRSAEDNEHYSRVLVGAENGENAGGSEDQNWSGLEGVTRVNSLVQPPRFSEERPRP